MRYLKKYNEELFGSKEKEVEISEDDQIAKAIIDRILPNIDEEEIQMVVADNTNSWTTTFVFKLNKSTVGKLTERNSHYRIYVDEDELDCSQQYTEKMYKYVENEFKVEKKRQKMQRITTNLGV
jgi:hypothetical protein